MIILPQYFGAKPHTEQHEAWAIDLLERVNELIEEAVRLEVFEREIDPDTGTEISGSRGGTGDGGFRLPTSTTGRQNSSHKEARGVDVYDPFEHLDIWLSSFDSADGSNWKLKQYGLYREAPKATPGWCHLTTRAPGSGRRTFNP